MAILWVYLPRYSTTDFGLPKGLLAKTTQAFCHNSLRICSYCIGSLLFNFSQYWALKTFDKAFTGKRNLPSQRIFFQLPCLSIPPPGTMQCKCGCRDKFCPQVCKIAIIPICRSWLLPNCAKVCQTASNKTQNNNFGLCIA